MLGYLPFLGPIDAIMVFPFFRTAPLKLPFIQMIRAHHVSHAALALGTVAAAVVFFAAGAVIRLLLGPVSLGPFAGTLDGAIQQALPGITLKYDQAAIEWTRDEGRVNLVVLGAKVLDRNGEVVAQAPKADIDLSARSLLSGRCRGPAHHFGGRGIGPGAHERGRHAAWRRRRQERQ